MQLSDNHICDSTCCKENSVNHLHANAEKCLDESTERKSVLLPVNMTNKSHVHSVLNGKFENFEQFKRQLKHKKKKFINQKSHNLKWGVYETEMNENCSELIEKVQLKEFVNKENILKPCCVMLSNLDIKVSSSDLIHVESDVVANIVEEPCVKNIKQDLYSSNISVSSNELLETGVKRKTVCNIEIKQVSVNPPSHNSSINFKNVSAQDTGILKPCSIILTRLDPHMKRLSEDISEDSNTVKKFKSKILQKESNCNYESLYLRHVTNNKRHILDKFSSPVLEEEIVKPCSVVLSKLDRKVSDIFDIQHSNSCSEEQPDVIDLSQDYKDVCESSPESFGPSDFDESNTDEEIEKIYQVHSPKKHSIKRYENCKRAVQKKCSTESSKYSDVSSSSSAVMNVCESSPKSINPSDFDESNTDREIEKFYQMHAPKKLSTERCENCKRSVQRKCSAESSKYSDVSSSSSAVMNVNETSVNVCESSPKSVGSSDFDESNTDGEIEKFYEMHAPKKLSTERCENCKRTVQRKCSTESSKYSDISSSSSTVVNVNKASVNSLENSDSKKIAYKPCIVLLHKLNSGVSFNSKHSEFEPCRFYEEQHNIDADQQKPDDLSFITVNGTSSNFDWMDSSDSDVEENKNAKSLSLLYFANKFKNDIVDNEFHRYAHFKRQSEEREIQGVDIETCSNYSDSTVIIDDMSQAEDVYCSENEYFDPSDKDKFQCSSFKEKCSTQDCVPGLKSCFVMLKRIDEADFIAKRPETKNEEKTVCTSFLPEECDPDVNEDLSNLKSENGCADSSNGNYIDKLDCNNEFSQLTASCESCKVVNSDCSHHDTNEQSELKVNNLSDSDKHISVHLEKKDFYSNCISENNQVKAKDCVQVTRNMADIKIRNTDFNEASDGEICESEKFDSTIAEVANDFDCDQDTLGYDDWDTESITNEACKTLQASSIYDNDVEVINNSECSSDTICNSYDKSDSFSDLQKSDKTVIKIEKPETDMRSKNYKKIEHDVTIPGTSVNSVVSHCDSINKSDWNDSAAKSTFRSKSGKKYIVEYFEYENIKKLFITVKLKTDTDLLKNEAECDKNKYVSSNGEEISNSSSKKRKNCSSDQHPLDTEVGNECDAHEEQNTVMSKTERSKLHKPEFTNSNNSVKSCKIAKRIKKSLHCASYNLSSVETGSVNSDTFIVISDTSEDHVDSESSENLNSGSDLTDFSNNNVGDLSCVQCMVKFSDKFEYFSHLCPGKQKKGYLCEYCEKIFSSSKQLVKHKNLHEN